MSIVARHHRGATGGPVTVSLEQGASSHYRRYACAADAALADSDYTHVSEPSGRLATFARCVTYLDALLLSFAAMFAVPAANAAFAAADATVATGAAAVLQVPAGAGKCSVANALANTTFLARPLGLHPASVVALLVAAVLIRAFVASGRVCEQSVTALRDVGLQLTTRTVGGATRTRLLDLAHIDGLLIHEGYFRQRCVFFLCAVVRDADGPVVLFDETLPGRAVLVPVLRGLRHVLYGEREHGAALAEQLQQPVRVAAAAS